jgi:hypothetical protein
VPIEQARAMDGLTLFKGLLEGRFPAPPITKALGFRVSEVELGRVVFDYRSRHTVDRRRDAGIHTTPGRHHCTTVEIGELRAPTDKTGPVRRAIVNVSSRIGTSRQARRSASSGARHDDLPHLPIRR